MKRLENYLRNVRFWLPAGSQSDDIVNEIREDLLSQTEGRDLNDAEWAALLEQRGDPSFVASQYGQDKPLIGSRWMPAYRFVMRLVVLQIILPMHLFIVWPVQWAVTGHFGQVWNTCEAMLIASAIITAIFAGLDRSELRLPQFSGSMQRRSARNLELVTELIGAVVSSWIWIAILRTSSPPSLEVAGVRFTMTEAWQPFLWPLLILNFCAIALYWFLLAWPMQLAWGRDLRFALNTAQALLVAVLLASGGPWIDSNRADAAEWANAGVMVTFTVILILTLYEAYKARRRDDEIVADHPHHHEHTPDC